ncbi:hypothetical protein [Ferruginibacter sp. SUN106]|uniref:hypothetical protein n=1 Tax=Ferruginibacter sp. SUN106 TaxID=2978348 RepID=UPI003D369366
MRFKKVILFKKLTAALLLLLLSAVTIIQVSHSHASSPSSTHQENSLAKRSGLPGYFHSTAESKCFICEYQLTKDVDVFSTAINFVAPLRYQPAAAAYYSFTFQNSYSFFETRGPPFVG